MAFVSTTIGLIAASASTLAPAHPAECDGLTVPHIDSSTRQRAVEPIDLVRLRDPITSSHIDTSGTLRQRGLSISPDGGSIALMLRRASSDLRGNCYGLFVVDASGPRESRLLHAWFEQSAGLPLPERATYIDRNAPLVRPQWSPDGRTVAFLKRTDGVVDVWIASIENGLARRISSTNFGVEDIWWSDDGQHIHFAGRPSRIAQRETISSEASSGYYFDGRFFPQRAAHPQVTEALPLETFSIDLGSEGGEPAPAHQAGSVSDTTPDVGTTLAHSPTGLRAWLRPRSPAQGMPNPLAPRELAVTRVDGSVSVCDQDVCRGVRQAWWRDDGVSLIFVRQEGWADSSTGIYEWRGDGIPTLLLRSNDLLYGCELGRSSLFCIREAPLRPPHLAAVRLSNGTVDTVFDFNPEAATWQLTSAERIEWRSENGTPAFGHLLLPAGPDDGTPPPLIVVGYQSRGFLRGGSGDEFPIQSFVSRGFAVLSFDRPLDRRQLESARSGEELTRAMIRDWTDRRNVQSALETGIQILIDRRQIDPTRIGITGFSEGSTIAQWALINRPALFQAASISECCAGPSAISAGLLGLHTADRFHSYGYPKLVDQNAEFWMPMALEINPARLSAPLLIQASDGEYIGAIPTFTRLRELGSPVEMYVFPEEGHYKRNPAHRLAVYQRNLDWFDFWLRGVEHNVPGRALEYRRWRDFRERDRRTGAQD